MVIYYIPLHNKGNTIDPLKTHIIRKEKKFHLAAKHFPLLQNLSRLLPVSSHSSFGFAARLRHLWGKFIILHRSVAIASRIFSLGASQSPIWLLHRTNGTSQIATACISLEYSALPPTRDGFSIFLENEASTRGLCHMITACSRSPRRARRPACPAPALRHTCRGKMAAVQLNLRSAKGPFAWTCVPSFSRRPTVTISRRGVKSFIHLSALLFSFLVDFFFFPLQLHSCV